MLIIIAKDELNDFANGLIPHPSDEFKHIM